MPLKEKVGFEEKRRLTLACISKEMGVCEAARIRDCDLYSSQPGGILRLSQ